MNWVKSDDFFPGPYWFHLTMFDSNNWLISRRIPGPLPQVSNFENPPILPLDIKRKITGRPMDIDRVVTLKKVRSEVTKVNYDVTYAWCSTNHIVGTVTENLQHLEKANVRELLAPGCLNETIKYLLNRYPGYREQFYRYYFTEMIPMVKMKIKEDEDRSPERVEKQGDSETDRAELLHIDPMFEKFVMGLSIKERETYEPL